MTRGPSPNKRNQKRIKPCSSTHIAPPPATDVSRKRSVAYDVGEESILLDGAPDPTCGKRDHRRHKLCLWPVRSSSAVDLPLLIVNTQYDNEFEATTFCTVKPKGERVSLRPPTNHHNLAYVRTCTCDFAILASQNFSAVRLRLQLGTRPCGEPASRYTTAASAILTARKARREDGSSHISCILR
eukprot:4288316-Pleurochrysis_carterae.AAC.1